MSGRFFIGPRPKAGESRRDYLAKRAQRRLVGQVPISVYEELVALHDRVALLETALESLRVGE